jgi:hypothetical protein
MTFGAALKSYQQYRDAASEAIFTQIFGTYSVPVEPQKVIR